ncbi:MAG: bifunctional folylpolyglutamate synthase/dihydrofolate synthase [Deltaproteobacteria bacterium]|nr:bifunctional folylpolyglutamate synthase/dihydrofolate synthase [Deltaproteobacteria bacterium]
MGIPVENRGFGANPEKTVQEAPENILDLLDAELQRRWVHGVQPGLQRIRVVLARLGADDPAVRVLVAGTNGKGSTTAFLDALLRAHGVRTGRNTSPHLRRAAERITVDGAVAREERLAEAVAAVRRAETSAGITLTGFEWITAVALEVFRGEALPARIIEVGLGGRLDATNACEPDLSVITPIGFDHMAILGSTLTAIAREKAGIFRAGRPAVIAAQVPEAAAVLDAEALALGAGPVLREGRDWTWRWSSGGLLWEHRDGLVVGPVRPGLAGALQGANASLALAAAAVLLPSVSGRTLDPVLAARALAETVFPGRFQEARLLGRRLLLDVGHNPHGLAALADSYRQRWGDCPAILFGLKEDKDAAGALSVLRGLGNRLVLSPLPGSTCHAPESLRDLWGEPAAELVASPAEGLARLPVTEPGAPPPLACGSHHLVGALLDLAD